MDVCGEGEGYEGMDELLTGGGRAHFSSNDDLEEILLVCPFAEGGSAEPTDAELEDAVLKRNLPVLAEKLKLREGVWAEPTKIDGGIFGVTFPSRPESQTLICELGNGASVHAGKLTKENSDKFDIVVACSGALPSGKECFIARILDENGVGPIAQNILSIRSAISWLLPRLKPSSSLLVTDGGSATRRNACLLRNLLYFLGVEKHSYLSIWGEIYGNRPSLRADHPKTDLFFQQVVCDVKNRVALLRNDVSIEKHVANFLNPVDDGDE